MNVKKYLGDLNGGSLLITESRVIAEIQLKKLPEKEWKQLIIDDNILQKKSAQTALRFVKVIRKRLEAMGETVTKTLLDAPERAYIQLLMAAFMVQSPVIGDYADMRISLDLDDGVKVNYGKFGGLLSDVKAVTGKK